MKCVYQMCRNGGGRIDFFDPGLVTVSNAKSKRRQDREVPGPLTEYPIS